jgi:4-amino-4-deoxy-L-arabinose transferase-like glycosyltransferase
MGAPSHQPTFHLARASQPQALVHGTREQWPWQGTFLAWRLMRLISIALVLTGCYFVWRAGLAISTPTVALLAVALLASSPQMSLVAGAVSNDALLFCLAAIITDCTLRARSYRHVGLLGVAIGAALITKQSAIVLVPLVIWPLWQHFAGWQRLWALLCADCR